MIRRIPVFSLVARSYVFTLMGAKPLAAATWPWISLSYIVSWLSKTTGLMPVSGELPFGVWISLLTNLVASSAVSVLCHRAIILGQWPSGLRSLHFGQRETYYLLALLGFGFIIASTTIVFTILTNILNLKGNWSTLILIFIVMVLYARMSMLLPDLSVSEQRLPWWHIWHITYGQTARITLGIVISSAPLALVAQQLTVVETFLQPHSSVWTTILFEFLGATITFLAMVNSAAFLAFAYKAILLTSCKADSYSSSP